MSIDFRSIYIRITQLLTIIFEKMTLRSKPKYEQLNDNEESIVYFDNPIRNKLI